MRAPGPITFGAMGLCAMLLAMFLAVSSNHDRCGWCDAPHGVSYDSPRISRR
jgi:hypothetical protein